MNKSKKIILISIVLILIIVVSVFIVLRTKNNNVKDISKNKTINLGDVITIKKEQFYVIAEDNTTITLLSKYNLNKEGTKQSNAGYFDTACQFSSTNYWKDLASEEDVDLNKIIDDNPTNAVNKAKKYGEMLGGEGRLLTYEEAQKLKNSNISNILFGKDIGAKDGYLLYWLGTSASTSRVKGCLGSEEILKSYAYHTICGVRPVIIISK